MRREIFSLPVSVIIYLCSLTEIRIYSEEVDSSELEEKE